MESDSVSPPGNKTSEKVSDKQKLSWTCISEHKSEYKCRHKIVLDGTVPWMTV